MKNIIGYHPGPLTSSTTDGTPFNESQSKLSTHLNVFDVGEWDADADDGPGVVVGEVETLGDFSAADGDEERAVDAAVADGAVRRRLDHLQSGFTFSYTSTTSTF